MSEINRREFLAGAAAVAAACASCGFLQTASASAPHGAIGGKVDVGPLSAYSSDGITDKFVQSNHLLVIRKDGKLYACSAVCTHKFKLLAKQGDHLHCFAHGSEFSIEGTAIKKPATDSLERYAISKNSSGNVIVDTDSAFREKDWEKPEASIDLKA